MQYIGILVVFITFMINIGEHYAIQDDKKEEKAELTSREKKFRRDAYYINN